MRFRTLACTSLAAFCLTTVGCSSIASRTNSLSDERILSETGGVLGLSPSELTLVERRTEGTNTYVTLKTRNGKIYACTVNGGNLLSFGMTNPPVCQPR
ncbi:hypothetical protein [Pseudoxanthomonas mexicana]